MPIGSAWPGDEKFTLSGTDYYFRFPENGGGLGFASNGPFAPKSTSGERSYQDYDAFSAVALDDLSGGMGQDRLTDVTRYYTAIDADARGGRIILGPLQHLSTITGPNVAIPNWKDSLTGTFTTGIGWQQSGVNLDRPLAQKFTLAGSASFDRVWLPLRRDMDYSGPTLTLSVIESVFDMPNGAIVANATVNTNTISAVGSWVEFIFSSQVTLAAGDYWFCLAIEGFSTPGYIFWMGKLGAAATPARAMRYETGVPWVALTDYTDLLYWYEQAPTYPDAPPKFFLGAGKDLIPRMWLHAGRYLYYISAAGTATVATEGATTKRLDADITSAVFFQGSGDTSPYIYIATGEAETILKYDADVVGTGTSGSGNVWAAISSESTANLLTVHDNKLWRCINRNEVSASLDGSVFADSEHSAKVGDKAYVIKNMLSWNGSLYVGKEDGLYKIDYPTGYPTTGEPTSVRVLNLTAQVSPDNFACMVEHQNDLWFSCNQGLLKLTTGNVLTSVTPETGLELNTGTRSVYRAGYSAFNTLWIAAEGQADVDRVSYLLAYFEGKWHPLVNLARGGDMIRSIAIEHGLYGTMPRVWYGAGLQVCYVNMPTTTQKRWLWDGDSDYAEYGYLITSWLDGNIRTINKDWVQVELDCANMYEDDVYALKNRQVVVYWRPDEATAWVSLGTVAASGLSTLAFPTGSYSTKCQLLFQLSRDLLTPTTTSTPQLLAIVLKYMERPRDVRAFTRTYELSSHAVWRNGSPVQLSLAEQVTQLETLRESAEPLTWTNWFGKTYRVHITRYNGPEIRERLTDLQDTGSIMAILELQEVA